MEINARVTPCGAESIVYFMVENHSLGNAARTPGLFAIAELTAKVAVICSRTTHKLGSGKFCVYSRHWVKQTHTIGPTQHSFPRLWGIEKALARFLDSK